MGVAALALDRIDEAERLGAEAVMRARRVPPPASVLTGRYLFAYGKALQAQGRFAEAERAMLEAYPIYVDWSGPQHPRAAHITETIAELYETWLKARPDAESAVRASQWREQARYGD